MPENQPGSAENDALFHRLERTLPRLHDRQGSITAYLIPVEEWRRLRAAVTRVIPPGTYCPACMEGEDSGLAHAHVIPPAEPTS